MKRSRLIAAATIAFAALGSFAVALPASAAPSQHHHKYQHKHQKHHKHHKHHGHHVHQAR